MKVHKTLLFLFAATALALMALPGSVAASGTNYLAGCDAADQPSLPEDDAAYPDAMALAQTLTRHSFVVTCVSPSQMTDTFDRQEGAAVYRTTDGDFEALFLPKSQTFDKLRVLERHDGQMYRYTFAGRPKPWPANLIESSFPLYFIKHGNGLVVAQDQRVAARVKSAIDGR